MRVELTSDQKLFPQTTAWVLDDEVLVAEPPALRTTPAALLVAAS